MKPIEFNVQSPICEDEKTHLFGFSSAGLEFNFKTDDVVFEIKVGRYESVGGIAEGPTEFLASRAKDSYMYWIGYADRKKVTVKYYNRRGRVLVLFEER